MISTAWISSCQAPRGLVLLQEKLLTVDAKLPDLLPFSDTELCSLFSNALENAICACENIHDTKSKANVVEKHGGICQFSIKDGWFIFQATT